MLECLGQEEGRASELCRFYLPIQRFFHCCSICSPFPLPLFSFFFFWYRRCFKRRGEKEGIAAKGAIVGSNRWEERSHGSNGCNAVKFVSMHAWVNASGEEESCGNVGKVVHDGSLSNEITRIGKTFIIREGKIFSSELFTSPPCKRVSLSTSFSIKRVNFGESLK